MRLPGKIDTPLNKMLEQVEWGEFKLWDLFESSNWDFDIQKNHINWLWEFVITAWLTDNWILWKTDIPAKIFDKWTITIDMFWYAFYRQFKYKLVTHARVFSLKPKFKITDREWLFISSLFHFLNKEFWYENMCSWAKIENKSIKLPTKNWKIDFEFMDKFVTELESIHQLDIFNYLKTTGLKNYKLSSNELKALEDFKEWKIERKEFKMGDLFERISTKKLPYKAKELSSIPTKECPLPCLTSSFMNQWLNYYAPKDNATVLKDVISIPSNSDVYRAYFQSNKFTVLSDAYAIRWKYYDTELSPAQYLFLVCCINQVTDLPIYSYKNKLGWWNVVKEKSILLPTNFYTPDLWFMNNFITAIEKILIKDVVIYNQERIKATDEIISEL